MEKVVLIIDSPEMCRECRFCECWFSEEDDEMKYACMVAQMLVPSDGKSDLCPLKPLPKEDILKADDLEKKGYVRGWTDCLAEITK